MAHGEGSRKSPFSPPKPRDPTPESSDEESVPQSPAASKSARGRSKSRRERSSRGDHGHKKSNRDPSYSYNKRCDARRRRREDRHERRRRTHQRRRERRGSRDKRRRSDSSEKDAAKPVAAAPQASRSQALEPTGKAAKGGTKKCPHCWSEITSQPSGRAQHQWSNRTCLQWQFYNQMAADVKEKDSDLAWVKAGKDAAALYAKRRWLPAPSHAFDMAPPPPVIPKPRSAPAVLRSRSMVKAAAPQDETEEIVVEEPPPPRQSLPQGPTGSTQPKNCPMQSQGTSAASGSTGSSASQKQQIVININS